MALPKSDIATSRDLKLVRKHCGGVSYHLIGKIKLIFASKLRRLEAAPALRYAPPHPCSYIKSKLVSFRAALSGTLKSRSNETG